MRLHQHRKARKRTGNNGALLFLLSLLLVACTKKVSPLLPGPGGQSASVNFYSASDLQYSLGGERYIFIDTPVDTVLNPYHQVYAPGFGSTNPIDQQEYPLANTDDAYHSISYIGMIPGGHRLQFTDASRQVIKDSAVILSDKSYTSFYLADAGQEGGLASYRLLAVPEEHNGATDKVRMRIINLGPDIGSISCYLQKADGSLLFTPLPQQLPFGTASPYFDLDTTGASRGQLTLQIVADSDPQHRLLTTRLSSTPDHAYVVVVQGFHSPATRQVPEGMNADGSIRYSTVNIPVNLRVNVRQSY